jgi:hypothetical protein
MTKKKATGGTEAKAEKSAKAKSSKPRTKETNSADVRKTVSTMVKSKALAMAEAVIGENEEGEVPKDLLLATVKYLFEVASIYPPQSDQDQASADEDCLAKTLLQRLNIPDEPIRRDEDEESKAAASEAKGDTKVTSEDAEENAGVSEGGEESNDDSVPAKRTQAL